MYRVRVAWNGPAGAPFLSTHYFDLTGGTAQQAATAVGAFWGAVDALINNAYIWTTESDVATVNAATGQVTSATSTTPVIGSGASAATALPRASQALVRWTTGIYVGGRQIRGRTFIPGITESSNGTDGLFSPADVATVNAAGAALIADANSQLLVWSPTLGQANIVTGASTWGDFAVLRSRRD
jgi:hypothetical protein